MHVITVAAVFLGLQSAALQADSHSGLEAHAHGTAHLNVAAEGRHLHIEFSSPAANIVGFEHRPRTPAQRAAVKRAMGRLNDPDALFILSDAAGCSQVATQVDTDVDHDEGHGPASAHGAEEKGHSGHGAAHDQDAHDDDDFQDHSDFTGNYQFACRQPEKLTRVDVMLIKYFPGIEQIKVQLVTDRGQTAVVLTARKHTIAF